MSYDSFDTEKAAPRVQFGARDDDSMPLSWAERGLTWLKAERPMVFADMMLALLGIDKRKRGSGA